MSYPEQASLENVSLRRNAARAAILEAARKVSARVGTAELSLSSVAAEAQFNASTVFGHFRNKDELLVAVVAEDLSAMAALMREWWPHKAPVATNVQTPPPPEEPVQDGSDQECQAEIASTDLNVIRLYTDQNQSAERQPPAIQAPEPDRPHEDTFVEERLHGFEHRVQDLEGRLTALESGASASNSMSEHGIKALFDRMEAFVHEQAEAGRSLTERSEETARRQREATAEMRAALNDTATRIEVLESQRRADQDRTFGKRPSDLSDVRQTGSSKSSERGEPESGGDVDAYRNAAERAASAAATLAAIDAPAVDRPAPRADAPWTGRLRTKQYLLAACAIIAAFVIGALVSFQMGHAKGRELAKTVQSTSAIRAPGKRLASVASRPRASLPSQAADATAQLILGLRLLHGEGIPIDKPRAAQWIRRAADQRNAVAQYWLGTLYEHGDGVAADAAEAVRWYEAAAMQDNRKAMHALGIAYAQGLGTQRDYSQAARWFSRAAEFGLVNSEFNLGVLYERGLGVPQSLLNAYKWYAIAAAQGDEESQSRVAVLKTQLRSDDLAAGERAVFGFRPKTARPETNDMPSASQQSASAG